MSCVVAPLLQLYIYGAVPPDTVKFTVPFAPELHATFAVVVAEPDNDAAGCVTVIADDTDVHPFPSVMVTVYVPADIFAKFCVLAPLLQLYIYGSVPPAGVKLMDAVALPRHITLVCVFVDVNDAAGCVMVIPAVCTVNPFAS